MDEKFYETLEQALAELESGTALETVLSAYPDLQPELEAAQMAQSMAQGDIPSGAASRSRTQILARAMQLRQDAKPRRFLFHRVPRFAIALMVMMVFLLSGGGLVAVSAQAIPGDQLYPVKRSFETVRLGLAISPESHRQIEEQFQSRRLDEVERLLALGRPEMVQFYGNVDQQAAGFWMVSGIKVDLTPETIILGEILPGMTVEVEGITQPSGWVQASEIHLQTFSFAGYVESLSTEVWRIAGREVKIAPESQITSDIQVGDWVMVDAQSDDFGGLTARTIELASRPSPTPLVPTVTATPAAVQTPVPSPDDDRGGEDAESGGDEDEDDTETPEADETEEPGETHETEESEESDDPEETDESDDVDDDDDESDD